MSWLLNTDVICQPAKRHGDALVIAWLEEEQDSCYTSAVVIAQRAYWVRTKDGRQRQVLQAWLTRLVDALHGRIHGFNASVAHVWGDQEALLDKAGQRMPVEDSYIAVWFCRRMFVRKGYVFEWDAVSAQDDVVIVGGLYPVAIDDLIPYAS